MELVQELEAIRKRVIQMVNTEFDVLIERAAAEELNAGGPKDLAEKAPYESKYPLTSGTNIFKGTRPTNVIFGEEKGIHVTTWKNVVEEVMKRCLADGDNKKALMELSDHISGRKRFLLSKTKDPCAARWSRAETRRTTVGRKTVCMS